MGGSAGYCVCGGVRSAACCVDGSFQRSASSSIKTRPQISYADLRRRVNAMPAMTTANRARLPGSGTGVTALNGSRARPAPGLKAVLNVLAKVPVVTSKPKATPLFEIPYNRPSGPKARSTPGPKPVLNVLAKVPVLTSKPKASALLELPYSRPSGPKARPAPGLKAVLNVLAKVPVVTSKPKASALLELPYNRVA